MRQSLLYILLFVISHFACSQNYKWALNDIDNKLRSIFPDANAIIILDSTASKQDTTDKLNMPLPTYKALVSEEIDANPRFVFYFYNVSLSDSSFSKIFRQFMLNGLKAGLGTANTEYVCGMPQFDKTGNKLIAYAIPLNMLDEKYIADKEKKIKKVFDLAETKVRDVKLEEIKN